ncbi:hypothetical protein DXG01_004034 [Tephrocybe rancida]|nr:hypothetical protein DXG01_004034 [Tephrocybe rancida]
MHVPTPPPPPQGALQPTRSATLRAPGFLKDFPIHSTLVPQLNDWGLIVSHRACTWSNWNGVIRLPQRSGKRWEPVSERRRAIRKGQGEYVLGRLFMLPEKSRGAALLHHTGSKSFVRTLTLRAEQMGLYFASTGLWKWHSDEEMEAMAGEGEGEESGDAQGFWQLLPSTDEEMIFEHLQMEFIEPTRRRALTPGRDL